MERLDRRLAEAAAALSTLDERDQVGQQIEAHLAAHAALLRRWLEALQRRVAAE
jgi:hypothetical protein